MERQTRRFRAQRENGEIVMIVEYQEFIDTTSLGSKAREWTPGLKRLELEDGGPVNFVDEHTFTIVTTGETVRIPR